MKALNGYVLGRVRPGANSVYVNSQSYIQVHIEMLSQTPQSYSGEAEINAFSNNLIPHGFEDPEFTLNSEERALFAMEFLENILLFFKIEQTSSGFSRVDSLDLRAAKLNVEVADFYHSIPVYNESSLGTLQKVLETLMNRKILGDNKDVSNEKGDAPRHILFKTLTNEYYAIGAIKDHQHSYGGFRYIFDNDEVYCTKLSEEMLHSIYFYNDIAFEPEEVAYIIEDLIQSEKPVTEEFIQSLTTRADEVLVQTEANIVETSSNIATSTELEAEAQFLQQFEQLLKMRNLYYNTQDLNHYHTTLKAGGLTILSGVSGTGKSQLVQVYAEALGLNEAEFLMIPVAPSWLDETDLLGYVDIQNNQYIPSITGLVSLLLEAEKYPQKTFIVCFDEMNLAKVEHYFSQFLSILEMDKNSELRKVRLYSEELEAQISNSPDYPSTIHVFDNIHFVGTVNTDESVHRFSDKVLDRSNIIQLKVEPFNLMMMEQNAVEVKMPASFNLKQFAKVNPSQSLTKSHIDFLWALNELMNDAAATLGFGPRIVKQMNQHMMNVLETTAYSLEDAFDLQVAASILPKIRGAEDLLLPLLGQYDGKTKTTRNSAMLELVNQYAELSLFTRTKQQIHHKAKELASYGYTM